MKDFERDVAIEEAWDLLIVAVFQSAVYDIRHEAKNSRNYAESVLFLQGTRVGQMILDKLKEEGVYNE